MEKQLSQMEQEAQLITDQWLDWLREANPLDSVPMPGINREIISRFIAVQHLRTQDTRSVLALYAAEHFGEAQTPEEIGRIHRDLLWDTRFIERFSEHLCGCVWIFARTTSSTSFQSSDHPVCFKSGDNTMWLKVGFLDSDAYAVYPMSPDIILYCHPRVGPFERLAHLDACLSPVGMDANLVEADNLGQVFFSSRLVISRSNDFDAAREFLPTIGTDTYAPKEEPEPQTPV